MNRLVTGQKLTDWCKENNITYSKVYYYMLLGLSVDEACNVAKNKRPRTFLSLNGKSLRSSIPVSMYNAVVKHIKKKGVSIEKAIELYKFNKSHRYMARNVKPVINTKTGKIYSTIKECAKDLKISACCLGVKVRKGYYVKYYKGENQ